MLEQLLIQAKRLFVMTDVVGGNRLLVERAILVGGDVDEQCIGARLGDRRRSASVVVGRGEIVRRSRPLRGGDERLGPVGMMPGAVQVRLLNDFEGPL